MKRKFIISVYQKITLVAFTSDEISALKKALSWLNIHDAVFFKKVRKYLKILAVYPKQSYDNEFFPKDKIWILQRGTLFESSPCYLASLFVHEAYHGAQSSRGVNQKGFSFEPPAYRAQIKFLKKHNDENSARYVSDLLKKKYWEKNYLTHDKKGNAINSSTLSRYAKRVLSSLNIT